MGSGKEKVAEEGISERVVSPTSHAVEADSRLKEMGYKQELKRSLGMLSVLGLAFAIMAPLLGLNTALNIALTNGGPVTIIWGWVLVSLVSLAIAASLAEICSVFPTSGGVYYWSAMLSTPKYSALASYVNGWLSLAGNYTVTASITFSGAQLILAAITLWDESYVPTAWQTVLTYWLCLIFSLSINVFFNSHLDKLNKVCLWWTGASVIIIIVTLLVKAPRRNSAAYAFGEFDASASGYTPGWSFFVGLLQAAYTLTGYGKPLVSLSLRMVAALCEEVHAPERAVPKAMVLSVAAAFVTGVVYLVPLNFVLTNISDLLAVPSLQPMPLLFKLVVGSAGGAFGLLFLILGIWAFAAVGSLTAASRCTWSFSRDGGIPASGVWKKVDKRFGLPLNALILSAVVDALLGCIYFGSSAAFNAFTGVATICLGASYMFPVMCSVLRRRELVKNAPFSLGRFGYAINILTICWVSFSIVLFCMPTAIPVTPSSMNYASVVFAGFTLIALLWYVFSARKHYTGPAISSVKTKDGVIQVTEQYNSGDEPMSDDSPSAVEGVHPIRA
ncbi:amino acid/polyamine transporter I [Filobasidium floriforme]|uniref:amino acid/polyamine transporter I n=1 Tax=Filobasidium floriforme TaxID=5210 RepID=UPI001E8D8B88|nr:amino acid/polyamine transporter I [Filobasidium floriforme]KAH8090415.1 amino acid/polyamine transporter I [Filobasidium floriforme]